MLKSLFYVFHFYFNFKRCKVTHEIYVNLSSTGNEKRYSRDDWYAPSNANRNVETNANANVHFCYKIKNIELFLTDIRPQQNNTKTHIRVYEKNWCATLFIVGLIEFLNNFTLSGTI